ncbi:NAD(P)/FAD-dependent oxidoreductase [Dokdonia sp.]|uniref:phytoene desaturase family protein n=1 Tax=Dokdonia sp. TaxID=2024995 RepID=UPI0032661721
MSIKNYKKLTPDANFSGVDHIIIGSGIGGLTVATWLARAGKKVVVFEQHYVPGGFTHSFKRKKGFNWDVGVHYIGNVGTGSSLKRLFDFITDNKVRWASMGDVYDVVHIADKVYEFKAGKENMRAQLISYFPDESKAINTYLKRIETSNKYGNAFFFEKTFKPILSLTIGKLIKRLFWKYSQKTTFEVVSSLTNNKRLIAVLCAQCGNYGLAPKRSSFAAHAMVIAHFMEGGYYPIGGADTLATTTIDHLTAYGGEVYINSKVDEIVVLKNKVQGIKINDRFISCKSVISNIGVNNTFNHLLSSKDRQRCQFTLDEIKPSTGHICLYVGLDISDKALDLPKNNVWYFKHDDIDHIIDQATIESAPLNFAYVSFPSAKDPNWADTHPNKATIQAITVGRYDWFKKYEEAPWMKRGKEYSELKQELEKQMLKKLYELFPQIKGHVIETEISTPLSTKHFTKYQHGEIYGLEHSPKRFRLPFLRPETKIKGLRLVGQDITIVGVAGAMLSGMLAAITILKFGVRKLFKQMK